MGAISCTNDAPRADRAMQFSFNLPGASRATETAFEAGDRVGVFVTEASKELEASGNTVNNEPLTFDGTGWNSRRPLYWNAGTYNVYAYYPHQATVESVSDLPFSLATDQRATVSGSDLTGYEASDLLWASTKGVTASEGRVNMQFRHVMSKITIRLVKGEDFEGEIPSDATVTIHNTVTDATVDLESGFATRDIWGEKRSVTARQSSPTSYEAIIVPQRLDQREPFIEVVMKDVSFLYESRFVFRPGVHHLVNIVLNKNPEQLKIEIGGEIGGWN